MRLSDAVEALVVIAGIVFVVFAAVSQAVDCLLGAAADGGGDGSPCCIEEVSGYG